MQKDEEDTFYFILTTSNHPPFAFDVDSKGFSRDRVAKKRGPAIPKDKKTLDQLGHIWYADDVMGKFIKAAEAYDPSTLLSLQAITRSASISATMFPYGKKRHSLLLLWRWHSYGPLCQRRRRQPSPDCADLGRTHPAPRRDL